MTQAPLSDPDMILTLQSLVEKLTGRVGNLTAMVDLLQIQSTQKDSEIERYKRLVESKAPTERFERFVDGAVHSIDDNESLESQKGTE